jgi:hypothetical protein
MSEIKSLRSKIKNDLGRLLGDTVTNSSLKSCSSRRFKIGAVMALEYVLGLIDTQDKEMVERV